MLWKMLVGEHVSWKDDFVHVDEAAVRNTGNKGVINVLNFDSIFTFYTSIIQSFQI